MTSTSTLADLARVAASVRLPAWGVVDDSELIDLQRAAGELRRRVDAVTVEIATEISRRSSHELGYAGLAQRLGARTPERLVQELTGVSARDARQLVAVGRLEEQSPIRIGIRDGELTVAQASAINDGLGRASERISADALVTAASELLPKASGVSVEELRLLAQQLRDELDAASIVDREAQQRERRYLRLYRQDDGMTRLTGLLDPESAALVTAVVDAATSPRRGGPRFTSEEGSTRAAAILDDSRTTEQLALDALVAVLEAGSAVDSSVLGPIGVPVHVLVTERDLVNDEGPARIEGQPAAISTKTARRRACANGITPIVLDRLGRTVLDLGRTQRLFTARQRTAIAARDGGCLITNCTRPPSWTEVHHIHEWSRGGPTNVDDGVLLCRFHHLWMHNNGWRIERDHRGYQLVPPPDIDPLQKQILLVSKSPLLQRLAG